MPRIDTASFKVSTNMPGLQVEGQSNVLRGEAVILRNESGFLLQKIEVSVKTLATGVDVRDEHMREHMFPATDGQLPGIEFKAAEGCVTP